MKILVTGGAGFIGSNFIRYWLKKHPKDEIINLDKLTYAGNLANLADVTSKNYKFVKGDIADKKLVEKLAKSVDVIVNFAAQTHVDRSIGNPGIFLKTNVFGTQVLLDAALKAKTKRFHHISTDEVFGALPLESKEKFDEKTPYNPRSPYAASKAAADHLVKVYYETHGLPVTITHCSNNFGPYQFPEKIIPLAITNLLEGEPVPIYGDGLHVRDWIWVEDHCEAIERVLFSKDVGETYCISANNEISNLELVKKILAIMKKDQSHIKHVEDRPGHDRRYALDATKIRKKLGWAPKHDLEQGLEKKINWYLKNTWWWKPLKKRVQKDLQKLWGKRRN